VQLYTGAELVNRDLELKIREVATSTTSANTIHIIDEIEKARDRIDRNVRDVYVLDSLATTLKRSA
jgi:hypothetical protein